MLNRRLYVAIGILSASLIAFQLALMQNLSVVQWNHFAYMIISVALLGFGASGTLLSLFRDHFVRYFDELLPILLAMCAISMASVMYLTKDVIPGFDVYMMFSDTREIGRLALVYLVYFLPFFFGGAVPGLVYTRYASCISGLYFADLLGAATGGALLTVLLWDWYPWQLTTLLSILPLTAAFLVLNYRKNRRILPVLLLCAVLSAYFISRKDIPEISQYKSLSKTLTMQGAKVILEKSSPYGHLHVVTAPVLRFAPGISLTFTQAPPKAMAMFNNGNWFGAVPLGEGAEKRSLYDYTLYSLPFVIETPRSVLMLDAGTAPLASYCLAKGVPTVTLVEENRVAIRVLKDQLAAVHDSLLYHPSVKMRAMHSRSFLKSDTTAYGLIVFPDVGSFGGTSGIMAVREQYLLTLEAFNEAWNRLNDNGYLMVNVWLDYPVRAPLKLLATLKETLHRHDRSHPGNYILLVRSWSNALLLVRKSPFTPVEVDNVRRFCISRSFDLVIPADISSPENEPFNQLQDESFDTYIDSILYGDARSFQDKYPFDVSPARDNHPYFYKFFKPSQYRLLKHIHGFRSLVYLETGYFFAIITLIQIFAAALILIILPLLFLKVKGPGLEPALLYFGGLGVGFMFVEIALIQQFILFLGQPIYAAAVVISLLLLFSGAGSLFSGRFSANRAVQMKVLTIVIPVILLYAFILRDIPGSMIGSSDVGKIALSMLLISPLAFVMGMAFPLGIRVMSDSNSSLIPWAWGVNGCASVMSAVLATIIALHVGFQLVLIIAAGAYLVALISVKLTWSSY